MGGITLGWNYDVDGAMPFQIDLIDLPTSTFPPLDPVVTPDGVAITVSLLMPTDVELVSQISFVPTDSMNGKVINCGGLTSGDTLVRPERVTLHGKVSLCAVCYQVARFVTGVVANVSYLKTFQWKFHTSFSVPLPLVIQSANMFLPAKQFLTKKRGQECCQSLLTLSQGIQYQPLPSWATLMPHPL